MSPFIVNLKIVTSVCISRPVMLDSVLSFCKRSTGCSVEDALHDLPLVERESDGLRYWAASQFFYRHIPATPAKQRKHTPFDEMVRYTNEKRKVSTGKGVDKSYLNNLSLEHIQDAIAFGVGDVDEVDFLLQNLTHFGSLRRSGHGKIVEASADPFDHDWSEKVGDQFTRPVPVLVGKADVVAGFHPPYWDKTLWGAVAMPSSINPIEVQKLLEEKQK